MNKETIEKRMEELKKIYSSGSLLKKKPCNGRTIKIESLDVETAERINRRVSACARQYLVESHTSLCNDELKFGEQESGYVKKKTLY